MIRPTDPIERLRAADPVGEPADVASTRWAGELRDRIAAEAPIAAGPARRRRRLSRRGLAIAAAALLVAGAGAGIAAVVVDRQAPPEVRRSVRAALDLPAPDRAALQPLPGGIREVMRADTPHGEWALFSVKTRDKGVLITDRLILADGTVTGSGLGACRPLRPDGTRVIAWCSAALHSGPATSPSPGPAGPPTSVIGRVSSEVARVEMRLADGTVVPGTTNGAFFVVAADQVVGPEGISILARDGAGQIVGEQRIAGPMAPSSSGVRP